jgi:hypothetical protein
MKPLKIALTDRVHLRLIADGMKLLRSTLHLVCLVHLPTSSIKLLSRSRVKVNSLCRYASAQHSSNGTSRTSANTHVPVRLWLRLKALYTAPMLHLVCLVHLRTHSYLSGCGQGLHRPGNRLITAQSALYPSCTCARVLCLAAASALLCYAVVKDSGLQPLISAQLCT